MSAAGAGGMEVVGFAIQLTEATKKNMMMMMMMMIPSSGIVQEYAMLSMIVEDRMTTERDCTWKGLYYLEVGLAGAWSVMAMHACMLQRSKSKIGGCCENDVIMRIFQREAVHVGFHITFCMPPPPQQNESSQIIKWRALSSNDND